MASFKRELDALQRVIYQKCQLKSQRLVGAPPTVARPVILWEAPGRARDQHIGRYEYTNRVTQYGKLYAKDLDELLDLQEKLQQAFEGLDGVVPVYNVEGPAGVAVGYLRSPELVFTETESLDVPFYVRYTVDVTRTNKPAPAPTVTDVYQNNKPYA